MYVIFLKFNDGLFCFVVKHRYAFLEIGNYLNLLWTKINLHSVHYYEAVFHGACFVLPSLHLLQAGGIYFYSMLL